MTQKVNWLIDFDGSKDNLDRLKQSLEDANITYKCVTTNDYYNERYDHFDDRDCVVYYGSLQIAQQIQKRKSWFPGAICNLDAMRCSSYYPLLGDLLLNSEYCMMPLGDLERNWKFLQTTLTVNVCS